MPRAALQRLAAAALTVVSASCASGEDGAEIERLERRVAALEEAALTTSTTTTSVTQGEPVTTTTTTPGPVGEAEVMFTELVRTYCDVGLPDPVLATITEHDGAVFLVEDVNGNQVLLDTSQRIVTSLEGPDGVLPAGYSFGCAPSVFVGFADH